MQYRFEKTQENGDATSNYNIVGQFPVRFKDFFQWVLKNDDSFRIEIGASNECFGGWLGNRLEIAKDTDSGKCYWQKREPENWFDEIADINITSVWANGGWGQMLYICTFDIAEQKNADNQEYKKGYQDGIKEFAERLKSEKTTAISCDLFEEVVRLSDVESIIKEMAGEG